MTKKRLILLVLLVVAIAACAKQSKAKRESEWQGLSESEARAKLDAKLPGKMPAEKREVISDKVVAKMRDRGLITEGDVSDDAEQLAAS